MNAFLCVNSIKPVEEHSDVLSDYGRCFTVYEDVCVE